MTDLEIYLHGTIEDIKSALMVKGLSTDVDFLIAGLCDNADRLYRKRLAKAVDENPDTKAPEGPGGVKHNE